MAFCQCWKPICFVFIFALGFFVFSNAPFSVPNEEILLGNKQPEMIEANRSTTVGKINLRKKRSPEGSSEQELSSEISEVDARDKRSIWRKGSHKHEHYLISHEISSEALENNPKYYFGGYSVEVENIKPRKARTKGKSNSSLTHKHRSKSRAKKAKVVNKIQTPADTILIKSKLIPRPEKKTNDSISVTIKQQPFHFHIPIVTAHPVELPPFSDILATALKYKHPLTVDVPTENKKRDSHSLLAKRELEEMSRIERNSPVLDFLDIDRMIMEEIEQHNGNKLEDLDNEGIKRSVKKVAPTDAVMQELVGDKDDLAIMQKRTKKSKEETSSMKNLNRKPRLTGLDVDIENNLRRKKRHPKISHHHRAKRGLGKWLKSIFHRKTSTTTSRPRDEYPSRKNPRDESGQRSQKNQSRDRGNIETSRKHRGNIKQVRNGNEDLHPQGDTSIDVLLPKYMRRSSYWERKLKEKKEEIPVDSDSSSEEDEPNFYYSPKKSKKEKKKRFKRGIFDELPYFASMNTNDAGRSTFPHMLQARDAMHPNIFTGNYFSPPIERFYRDVAPPQQPPTPLTSMSKEEMKIVHEIFSNIINEKCYPVNSQVLEVLQYTVSSLIENSQWPDMSIPNNPQVDLFLQKVVNCSSDKMNVMAWKSQRSMQMSFNFEDIEEGSPLLRTKRITDFDIEQEKQKRALQNNYINDGTREPKMMPILLNQLDQLLVLMSNLVVDACSNVDTVLMTSALELMRFTIKDTFPHIKVTTDTMANVEAEGLIKSLKKCSTFTSKNLKNILSGQNLLPKSAEYNPNFQGSMQSNNQQNFQPQQNQMNYWDKIPPYSLYPQFPAPTAMLPQPSPVPAPPLMHPENFNINQQENRPQNLQPNYHYNNGYSYSSSSSSTSMNNPPNKEMGSSSFQYSDNQQEFRPRRNSFVRTSSYGFPIIPEAKKPSYEDNYYYRFK